MKNLALTSFSLKVIAIIAMAVDHVGFVLFPDLPIFRMIGRITIPLLTFIIAISYFHTSNKNKYIMRIGIFAVISQIPYMLVIANNLNILFNYFFVLLLIRIWECEQDKVIALALSLLILPLLLLCDGSWFILPLILGFMCFKNSLIKQIGIFIMITLLIAGYNIAFISLEWGLISIFMLLAAPLMFYYNGKKGKSLKYFFYIFYPGHFLILYLIKMLLS